MFLLRTKWPCLVFEIRLGHSFFAPFNSSAFYQMNLRFLKVGIRNLFGPCTHFGPISPLSCLINPPLFLESSFHKFQCLQFKFNIALSFPSKRFWLPTIAKNHMIKHVSARELQPTMLLLAATFYAVRLIRLNKERERDLNWVTLPGRGPSWANPQN